MGDMILYQKHTGDMEKRARILRKEGGFTLIEVLFAIAILSFGLLAVAKMQGSAIQGNFFAGGKTEAITWAQDRMETLMALPYTDAELGNGHHDDPNAPPNYPIGWDVTDLNDDPTTNCKLIIVKVTPQIRGVEKQIQLTCVKPQM